MRLLFCSIVLFFVVECSGQPVLPKPITFAWDKPNDLSNIIAYELQWGSGFAILNTNLLTYIVPNFPLGTTNEVSIKSIAASGDNSIPSYINVFNVVINLEQNFGDGWKVLTNMQVTVQIDKSHALFRARIDTK